jgi:hypothetical protein
MPIDKLTYEQRPPDQVYGATLPPWQVIWFNAAVHNVFMHGCKPEWAMHHITDTLPGCMIVTAPEAREETERLLAPLLAGFRAHMARLMDPVVPSADEALPRYPVHGTRVELPVLLSLP